MSHDDLPAEHTSVQQAKEKAAEAYLKQARRLAHLSPDQAVAEGIANGNAHTAVEADFVTPHDPVLVTADGERLPVIPVDEAVKLNALKAQAEGRQPQSPPHGDVRQGIDGSYHGTQRAVDGIIHQEEQIDASLGDSLPSSRTNPLFPPLPLYGPPSLMRTVHCFFFRLTSFWLSLAFLVVIALNALSTAVPRTAHRFRQLCLARDPDVNRPFYKEEKRRRAIRRAAEKAWVQNIRSGGADNAVGQDEKAEFMPLEGGADPLINDARYYARRVGLEMDIFDVDTEDGFIIELWHLYNPRKRHDQHSSKQKQYPVLMIHGLLQSAGAFCCNDDDSLAFYLAKSGYDVWLGNNRCGSNPRHRLLNYGDARLWCWNIRQMGVLDLPALIDCVLTKTGFPKLALIAHSQGTTQTFVALAKEQRPDIGAKISVFCALAPAVYAGPLIDQIYFKVMRAINPAIFRLIFGIHAFIPFMMTCHAHMPGKIYSVLGYHVFSSLFNWSDERWDQDCRDRMFQFAPVYVSAESMRWWLGRECFAKQRCILATREEGKLEDKEDEEDDEVIRKLYIDKEPHMSERRKLKRSLTSFHRQAVSDLHKGADRGKYAWYDKRFPPLALWVAGNDNLVDGRRLLRRFDRGREPDVRIVHKKIIEGYEHLDVIWAMDAIEKVGKEIRDVVWHTIDPEIRTTCLRPKGCEEQLDDIDSDSKHADHHEERSAPHSHGRLRMASISETQPENPTQIDATRGPWRPDVHKDHTALEPTLETTHGIESRRPSQALFTDVQERKNPFE